MTKDQRTINNQWHSWFFIFCFLFSVFCLMLPNLAYLQNQAISPPETLEGLKEWGKKTFEFLKNNFLGILKKVWQEALSIWEKMWEWFKINIWSKVENWFNEFKIHFTSEFKREIWYRLRGEAEKRKPIIEEEFKKEKEELKEELPKVRKSLWEKFKELIK